LGVEKKKEALPFHHVTHTINSGNIPHIPNMEVIEAQSARRTETNRHLE